MSKRIIAVLLSAVMIFMLIPVGVFAAGDELKLTVTTDTHYYAPEVTGNIPADDNDPFTRGMLNREVFYYATQQGQMNFESPAIMKAFLEKFIASDDEYLLIGGDLTNGNRLSHLGLAKLLKDAEERSGKKIFVTAGNHDCVKKSSDTNIDINEFKEIYADFGFNEALALHKDSASYTYDLNGKYRLLAIDSCIYGADDGDIDKGVYNWIKEQVAQAEKDGKKLIAMMHHSILPHFEVQPMMDGYMKNAKQFADWGIKFVFTGHIHANDISVATSDKGNTIYDIQTGSLITNPHAYRHVTVSDDAFDIKSDYITEINVNDLPAGYSEEQLDWIKTDFQGYSKAFFEAGMCRWLNRYIGSAGKVGKTLKLKEDGKAYELLNSIMLHIGDALLLPIYDDGQTPDELDSLQEIAESVGRTIPASDYEKMYQIAGTIMGGFYHGDEPTETKEKVVPLFLDCVKVALAHTISNMIYSGCAMSEFDRLIEEATGKSPRIGLMKRFTAANYAVAAAGKLASALIDPLLAGLSGDYSEPSDINVTLESFDGQTESHSFIALNFIKKIMLYFRNVFNFIFNKK